LGQRLANVTVVLDQQDDEFHRASVYLTVTAPTPAGSRSRSSFLATPPAPRPGGAGPAARARPRPTRRPGDRDHRRAAPRRPAALPPIRPRRARRPIVP